MKPDVVIVPCEDYSEEATRTALEQVLAPLGGLDWVRSGMRIAVKVNLVTFAGPEKAATTHPGLLCALVELLAERGADVVVGDSPGGRYSAAHVGRVYAAAGVQAVERYGGRLNQNFEERQADFPAGKVCRQFQYTAYLGEADVILNFCKLKTHGMMAMTCGAKNMFGAVPAPPAARPATWGRCWRGRAPIKWIWYAPDSSVWAGRRCPPWRRRWSGG